MTRPDPLALLILAILAMLAIGLAGRGRGRP